MGTNETTCGKKGEVDSSSMPTNTLKIVDEGSCRCRRSKEKLISFFVIEIDVVTGLGGYMAFPQHRLSPPNGLSVVVSIVLKNVID